MDHEETAIRIWAGWTGAEKCRFAERYYASRLKIICDGLNAIATYDDAVKFADDLEAVLDILSGWSQSYNTALWPNVLPAADK